MKAMILAAGFGTRLGELGRTKAKCLVEAGPKTMLEHVVDSLKRAGVTELVINLHHLGKQIRSFVETKQMFGLKVHFSEEAEILGTGGGILHARKLLDGKDPFIVHNGDIFSELMLKDLVEAQIANRSIATLAVMKRHTSRPLFFDQAGNLVGWRGETDQGRLLKPQLNLTEWAFSGIQVISPTIFELMQTQTVPFSSIASYMLAAEQGHKIAMYDMSNSFWIDIGTPEKLEQLRTHLA